VAKSVAGEIDSRRGRKRGSVGESPPAAVWRAPEVRPPALATLANRRPEEIRPPRPWPEGYPGGPGGLPGGPGEQLAGSHDAGVAGEGEALGGGVTVDREVEAAAGGGGHRCAEAAEGEPEGGGGDRPGAA